MNIIPDWRMVLLRAWSVWAAIAAGILSAAAVVIETTDPEALNLSPARLFAVLAVINFAIPILRVIPQRKLGSLRRDEDGGIGIPRTRRGKTGIAAVLVIAAAVPSVQQYEGRSLTAYRDIVGVWTICDGVTAGVRAGQVATNAECDRLLSAELQVHADGLSACVVDTYEERLPIQTSAALVSWTYNVGVGAACSSTLVRKLNAGDYAGACDQLSRWNRAGGRAVRGLTIRREAERADCIAGLQGAGLL